jgi:hypothetical protein
VIETFYAVNQRMAAPETRDDTLVALGEKFSHLKLESMKTVVQQTRFFGNPNEALNLMTGPVLKPLTARVVDFCVKQEIVPSAPKVGYGTKAEAPGMALRFDPTYIREATAKTK